MLGENVMIKIIDLNVCLAITDDDILVEDNSSTKAVVGTYDGFITLDLATNNGKQTYIITKQFAKNLAKALQEKAQ